MSTRYLIISPILVVLLFAATLASAQGTPKLPSHAHAAADTAASQNVPVEAQGAATVVDQFGTALQAGDLKAVELLLDPEVLILESGGAERSRQEYLSHHAVGDAKFLKEAHVQLLRRTAGRSGDLVWVGSESEIHFQKEGKPITLLSTETMVLKNVSRSWRIVHIHWSSRPQK